MNLNELHTVVVVHQTTKLPIGTGNRRYVPGVYHFNGDQLAALSGRSAKHAAANGAFEAHLLCGDTEACLKQLKGGAGPDLAAAAKLEAEAVAARLAAEAAAKAEADRLAAEAEAAAAAEAEAARLAAELEAKALVDAEADEAVEPTETTDLQDDDSAE